MFELRTVVYKDALGNICGKETEYRTKTLALSLGVLVYGAWGAWIPMTSTIVEVLV